MILRWGAATLHESCPVPNVLPPSLRSAWEGARVVGPAFPVKAAPGDNLALHWALVRAQPGDVIVVDAHDAANGHWGEVMAAQAITAGIAGLVIWGGVRDTKRQAELGFPVFSSCITPRGTVKQWAGTQGLPITIGEVAISLGDLVVGDGDGVVVIPREHVEETLRRAAKREADEIAIIARLKAGATTLDVYGLDRIGTPVFSSA